MAGVAKTAALEMDALPSMEDVQERQMIAEKVKIQAKEEQLERVYESNLAEITAKYERKRTQLKVSRESEEERANILEALKLEEHDLEAERRLNQAKASEAVRLEQARKVHEEVVAELRGEAERRKAQLKVSFETDLEQLRQSLQNASNEDKPLSRVQLARKAFDGEIKLTNQLLQPQHEPETNETQKQTLDTKRKTLETKLEKDISDVERQVAGKIADEEAKLEALRRASQDFEAKMQLAIERDANVKKASEAMDFSKENRVARSSYDEGLEKLEREEQGEIASLAAETEKKRRMSIGEIRKLQQEEDVVVAHNNIAQLTEEERKRRIEQHPPAHSKLNHSIILEELNKEKTRRNSRLEKQPSLHFQPKAMVAKLPKAPGGSKQAKAFTEKLNEESLQFFNDLTQKKFSEQAIAFLNAYWLEIGDQAEFIFSVAWETMKYADMHTKGVQYIHLYDEGNDLDFNVGLYFYEKLCKKVLEDKEGSKWRSGEEWKISMPTMMTAIVRKKELRDKVDVNFDGKVSFLEYLLYQYREKTNPAEFTERAMKNDVQEHPAITKAKKALEEVNAAISKFEQEKMRLETLAASGGVKGLGAKHELAILEAGVLGEDLNKSLISAEAAVRLVSRKFGSGIVTSGASESRKPNEGSIWWLNRDLEMKKQLYGRKSNKK